MLLNACLSDATVLDGLFCASSPLDLAACSASIERPRNRLYQHWLLKRLVRQTAADPFGLSESEEQSLCGNAPPTTIRAFDAAITAPRWGYADVEDYYRNASPLPHLRSGLPESWPPTLMLQALDSWCLLRHVAVGQSQASGGPQRFSSPAMAATTVFMDRTVAGATEGGGLVATHRGPLIATPDRFSCDHVLPENRLQTLRRDLPVPTAIRPDQQNRAAFADAQAIRLAAQDNPISPSWVLKPQLLHELFESVPGGGANGWITALGFAGRGAEQQVMADPAHAATAGSVIRRVPSCTASRTVCLAH